MIIHSAGIYGFTAASIYRAAFPDVNKGKNVCFQGSRQMTNISRQYYERELGAGYAPSPGMNEAFGYTEPLRRFIQRESFEPQANEIPNTMPGWLPGDDYMTNFKVGDPYVRIDDGYARLPGAGYEALHPELKGVAPEDYPDIHKLRILADVAPYSREYDQVSSSCANQEPSRAGAESQRRCSRNTAAPETDPIPSFHQRSRVVLVVSTEVSRRSGWMTGIPSGCPYLRTRQRTA